MNKLLFIILIYGLIQSCGKQEIGYLETINSAYIPDSVVFKAALDPAIPADAQRIKFEIPFQSQGIQGIQGTLPISYSIARIECSNGATDKLGQFGMVGKAQIKLPFNHTVPAGRYVISVSVRNEGHISVLDSALTVIIR